MRDWLQVQDHCSAIDTVFHFGRSGDVYNIGYLDKSEDLIEYVQDRLGHD